MDEEAEQIVQRLRSTPPVCIRRFRAQAAGVAMGAEEGCTCSWDIACRCGEERGRVLGYALRDYAPGYVGTEYFLTPLALECAGCETVTEILDTACHGYHAEVARIEGGVGSAKLRGVGPRQRFRCAGCGGEAFKLTVEFVYWNFDLFLEEPELPCQEFFNEFLSLGRCAGCGKVSPVTDLGKL